MQKHKCIGIIGGVGPQATGYLYRTLIDLAQEQYGAPENHLFPRVLIVSEPVLDFISSKENVPVARKQIFSATDQLLDGGATCIAIVSNTVHLLASEVEAVCEKAGVQFVSMLNVVAETCATRGFSTVGLLGSPVTLQSDLYDLAVAKQGVQLFKPSAKAYAQLGCIIKEVIAGNVSAKNKKTFLCLLSELSKDTDAVILGCTELPVLNAQLKTKYMVVDTSKVLAIALLEYYYITTETNHEGNI
ncbi:MAG: amino acid racemase [Pseudomonadales bacterium]|nr:amino acid racemase [Candidatus Woesebacteria bacterium]MCB9801028.1 amino acid racemase [Pseudomonadales bacterium]